MHLALGLLRPEDRLDEDDDDAEIAVERIGKLLMGAGEKPLIAAEWAEMKQLMDPKGTGRVSVKAFRDLPCWAPHCCCPPQSYHGSTYTGTCYVGFDDVPV